MPSRIRRPARAQVEPSVADSRADEAAPAHIPGRPPHEVGGPGRLAARRWSSSIGADLPTKFDDAQKQRVLLVPARATPSRPRRSRRASGSRATRSPRSSSSTSGDGGLTQADLDRIEADREALNDDLPRARLRVLRADSLPGRATRRSSRPTSAPTGRARRSSIRSSRRASRSATTTGTSRPGSPAGPRSPPTRSTSSSTIDGTLLLATGLIVFILLLAVYRSPVFWFFPFLAVIFAELASRGLGYGLTEIGVTVNGQSAGILPVLVFGAGTDYALLLVARYREELRRTRTSTRRWPRRCAGPARRSSPPG